MRTMTVENAVPIAYQSASMEQFGYRETSPLDSEKRDHVLARYYLIASEGNRMAARLFDVIGRLNGIEHRLTDAQVSKYKAAYAALLSDLETLHKEANTCLADARQCPPPKLTSPLGAAMHAQGSSAGRRVRLTFSPKSVAFSNAQLRP